MKKANRYIVYFVAVLKEIVAFIWMSTFGRNLVDKNIWLIHEKQGEARDNGYHLFKHIEENYSDIKVYYVIKRTDSDYGKVSKCGKTIPTNSIQHYYYSLACKYSIGSQPFGAVPFPIEWHYKLNKIFARKDQKVIYLKHGIYKDEVPLPDYKYTQFSLVCCASDREQSFIKDTYGYPPDVCQLTGLCRYDNLLNKSHKRQILIMPTFRMWLMPERRDCAAKPDELERFKKSSYYGCYTTLLADERLLVSAKRLGYSIIFYPHYSAQPYIELFKELENDVVTIADRYNYDVQKLLIESAVLITDYSSVFFDFSYMIKPTIFYQFDESEYRTKHYKEGYFDYRRDGFGPVFDSLDQTVDYTIKLMETECVMDNQYRIRANAFFATHDQNNCRRTVEAILSLR